MGFLIFLFTALIAYACFESFGGSILIGIIFYFINQQHHRLKFLELKSSSKPASTFSKSSLPSLEPSTPQKTPHIQASSEPLPEKPHQMAEISPPALPRRETIPSKPFVQQFEEFAGPEITNILFRGNPIARIGAIIFFFGVAFALKLAADKGFFPVELRLVLAACASMIFLFLGWKLRNNKTNFGLILQGTGSGVFYITTFIAFKLFHFIPSPLAFLFFVLITSLSGLLAVLQDSRSLAALAMFGGFLAPGLASEGGGSHIALFSYIALLNLGIFGMCWKKAWRSLNLVGYLFTFLIGAGWASEYYSEELYLSTQLFLVYFALFFTLLSTLYTIKQKEAQSGSLDTFMTFGTPLLCSLLQWNLVDRYEYGIAISCAAFGTFHILLARSLFGAYGKEFKLMVESLAVIGLVLISLAVPFTFSPQVSSAIWALEGAALVWSGIRQERFLTRTLGLALLPLASVLFLSDVHILNDQVAFLNPVFLGVVFLTIGHLLSGSLLLRDQKTVTTEEKKVAFGIVIISFCWWFLGGFYELSTHIESWFRYFQRQGYSTVWLHRSSFTLSIYSLFTTISIFCFWNIFHLSRLEKFLRIRLFLMPAHLAYLGIFLVEHYFDFLSNRSHLFGMFGFITWPIFIFIHYWMLYSDEKSEKQTSAPKQHTLTLWLLITMVTWEISWFADFTRLATAWHQGCLILLPSLFSFAVVAAVFKAGRWPFLQNGPLYSASLFLPVYWSLALSFVFDFVSDGGAHPLPYVPLLNPLDLSQATALVVSILWVRQQNRIQGKESDSCKTISSLAGPWLFVWATSTLLRVLSHYVGVQWDFDPLFRSNLVQASLSIFWSILALTLMVIAHRKSLRKIWQSGAVLIGVVVIKLFLIDLSSQETFARIAAFLGVGLLMLGIGYLAPIPPLKDQKEIK